jgi:integrase
LRSAKFLSPEVVARVFTEDFVWADTWAIQRAATRPSAGRPRKTRLRIPFFPTIRIDNVRKGFFERADFERVRKELPDYLRPLVTMAYWTGWLKAELLRLEWRQVDLEAGSVRLDPGTTKNREGRLAYLPAEALTVLRAWRERITPLERKSSRIVPHVFHNNGRRSAPSTPPGGRHVIARRCSADFSTISGEPQRGTISARAFPSAWRCRCSATGRAPSSTGTTS